MYVLLTRSVHYVLLKLGKVPACSEHKTVTQRAMVMFLLRVQLSASDSSDCLFVCLLVCLLFSQSAASQLWRTSLEALDCSLLQVQAAGTLPCDTCVRERERERLCGAESTLLDV